jgi:hypothetical protein
MKRRNISWLKNAVRQKYAWPGGYPLSAITSDGAALCMECVRENWGLVAKSTIYSWRDGWCVSDVDIIWEGGHYCDNCGKCVDAYNQEEGA